MFKVGDILVSSWGYEQTNRDFYQVVKVGKMVTIRQIESHVKYGDGSNGMTGTCVAMRDRFIGKEMRRKVHSHGDSLRCFGNSDYELCRLWDYKPASFTSYA